MKNLLLLVPLAAVALAGCSGAPEATAEQEKGFKNPRKTPPAGFTTPPPAAAPSGPPAAATTGG